MQEPKYAENQQLTLKEIAGNKVYSIQKCDSQIQEI